MKYAIVMLAVLLLGSNAWWLYNTLDQATTAMYAEIEENESRQRTEKLLVLMRSMIRGMSVEELKLMLSRELPQDYRSMFDKEGAINIPLLSFPYDSSGELIGVE